MKQNELSKSEMLQRKERIEKTRNMICKELPIVAEDETSVMTTYRDFYLQISFSELHPLMVFCLARPLETKCDVATRFNEMNLKSILGSHAVNKEFDCYNYRATHWLDTELEPSRFFEILSRCADEAIRGYHQLECR